MYVELGNPAPVVCVKDAAQAVHLGHAALDTGGAPAVTYVHVPDGEHASGDPLYGFDPTCDINAIARHLLARTDGISQLPGHEALLAFISPAGLVGHHHGKAPSWVRCTDNPEFAEKLAEFYECPVLGADDNIEDTHLTVAGPPGVVPGANISLQANITQNGRDIWARALGGGQVGYAGTATASSATSLTSGAAWSTNQWAGCRVFAATGGAPTMVWGTVVSNTATVLTVDQWYNPASPGGGASTTPSATGVFVIMDGNQPAWFMGLTANTGTPASPSTATSLTGEITTASGGLIRKICPYAHTASANTYTLTPVFTANGSDALPVTVAKIGVFDSMVVSDATSTMLFETLLNTTATLSASGDQLTVTETVTGT